jgi:hypothetical protein
MAEEDDENENEGEVKMKKQTNKKPAPVIPIIPVLTRPVGVAVGKGSPKAELLGHEEAVDRIIEIRREVESLETEEKLLRPPVEAAAKNERAVLEGQTGRTIKSVVVQGTHQPVRFTWRNAYRPTDTAHESALRACLGVHFDSLFDIRTKVKPREITPAIIAELRAALGDRFGAIFEATPEIVAREELLEKRTVLRGTLNANQNAALDQILDQIQASPALVTK